MIRIATGGQSDSMQIARASMAGRNNSCFWRGMSHRLQVTGPLTFGAEWGGTPGGMGIGAYAWGRLMRPMSETSGRVAEWSNQKGQDSCSWNQGQAERAGPGGMEWTSGVRAGSTTELRNAVGGWWWDSGSRQGSGQPGQEGKRLLVNSLFISPPPLLPTRHWR